MMAASRIGLGTVQFGVDYGITNAVGKVPEREVAAILKLARDAGINVLDTASTYGASEAVLGRTLQPNHGFRIVGKTPACRADKIGDTFVDEVRQALDVSHRHLGALDSLLVHHATDLVKPGAEKLVNVLERLRADGKVRRIGVSVYTADELDAALDTFSPDLVQLPFSIVDQRLRESGHLARLKVAGIEVHARSIFLQGALLADPCSLPAHFSSARETLEAIGQTATELQIGRLGMCLLGALSQPELDIILLGVTQTTELAAILEAVARIEDIAIAPRDFGIDDVNILNPALWPADQTP